MTICGFMGGYEWFIILIPLLFVLIAPIWCLVDCLKSEFKGNEKILWVLLIIFIPFLGMILYLSIGRKQKVKNITNLK